MTIFGGTGDLTCRKLMPALCNLYTEKKLSEDSLILAVGRRDYTNEDYRTFIHDWILKFVRIKVSEEQLNAFMSHVEYLQMDFTREEEYARLKDYDEVHTSPDAVHLVYLAVAPRYFDAIADGVKALNHESYDRIILEKPFGDNLEHARTLNKKLESAFGADHLYRIDHYLGKEMIPNILTIRSANPFFANIWDCRSIEKVEINALETVGVGTRGGYYDASGAVKDMVQNHLFQVLSIAALEDPRAEDLHHQQIALLSALEPIDESNVRNSVVLGQYEGYQKEDKVAEDSHTETYARIRLRINTSRWQGVPFYIQTGKKLLRQETSILITLKPMYPGASRNQLKICIQPTEEIQVDFNVKKPGEEEGQQTVSLEYCQSCNEFFQVNTPESYERMLYACMKGDSSWFTQFDQIEISWNFVNRMMDAYRSQNLPVYSYQPESSGPSEAEQI